MWTNLRKVGKGVLELLIGNSFGTFDPSDLDPKINSVHLLPRTDVWTKFEEGRSRHSRVIDLKPKGYRRTNLQTHKLTNMCKAICTLFFERGA